MANKIEFTDTAKKETPAVTEGVSKVDDVSTAFDELFNN